MPIVYVLDLGMGRKYVGYTNNFKQRINSHFNGRGAMVTRKYKPQKIIKIIRCYSKAYGLAVEKNVTENMAKKYGWAKVRGSYNCNSKNF
jgi:predicted GIY-YIG superfamily endonuclease|tara:strand:- start:1624 stop:1893 length:270 start_codon:yes stop_codon:yes gene_type:complete